MSQYKLVPVEPTDEMELEGMRKARSMPHTVSGAISREQIWGAYKAMLAAAPEPAQEPVAWMYWDRMAGEYDVRVGKDEPNVVGATPLYAAPAPPTNLSDARDAERWRAMRNLLVAVDWMYGDPPMSIAAFELKSGVVMAGPVGADAIADAAIAALAAQGGTSK